MEINVQFHLFQEITDQFTVVIVSDNTNQMIQAMIDIQEMIEVHVLQEMIEVHVLQEMIEVQDIQEMIEVQEIMIEKILR